MALHYAIRRAASKFVPSAAKFLSSAPRASASASAAPRYFHHNQASALFATAANASISQNRFQSSIPSLIRHYFTKRSADFSLIREIESEIQCAEESQDSEQVEEVPQGFPFKIEDNPGEQTITLTREYHGENISVEVHMPVQDIIDKENDNDNDEEGEERGSEEIFPVPLMVRVSKKGGPFLEFGINAGPKSITIITFTTKDPEISEDQIPYEGPNFLYLDEHLQKAFYKYLEVRGIKHSTMNFLREYMVEKDSREYITWLKKIQKIVLA